MTVSSKEKLLEELKTWGGNFQKNFIDFSFMNFKYTKKVEEFGNQTDHQKIKTLFDEIMKKFMPKIKEILEENIKITEKFKEIYCKYKKIENVEDSVEKISNQSNLTLVQGQNYSEKSEEENADVEKRNFLENELSKVDGGGNMDYKIKLLLKIGKDSLKKNDKENEEFVKTVKKFKKVMENEKFKSVCNVNK